MTEHDALVAVGTAATVVAAMLLLLRGSTMSRPLGAVSAWWMAASASTSALVIIALAVIAVSSFGSIGSLDAGKGAVRAALPDAAVDGQGLGPLRAYASKIEAERQPVTAGVAGPKSAEVSDVDTMIAKLAARLEKEPDDVKGWKMLGWSYLNMDRPEEAIKAYETALKLEPSDPAIAKALEQAKSAQSGGGGLQPSSSVAATTQPADAALAAAEIRSVSAHDSMIRGMVEQLAARLEVAPADEAGWLQLIRSRVTLDDRDAAKAALKKALDAFANDAAV
ncbi:MAG: tetratricopeptide repeat protein, partial [Verrucomicrobiae bacterium]|nr:tetratricopeptide repeat protein [Verrucomicrobiae bacterium]